MKPSRMSIIALKACVGLSSLLLILILTMTMATSVQAETTSKYSFAQVWGLVRERAPEIHAANHDLEAARLKEIRTSRHWYPRVFTEGRAFSTNDPAFSFMSLLGQRQIAALDFAPQSLNQPGNSIFEHAMLGLDLPLFEGGAKVAQARASMKITEAKKFERSAAEITQYSELANAYSSILSLLRQRKDLERLANGVDATLSHYKVGAKSNPVGYSGLLGLKNLKNRTEGLLADNSGKLASLRARIQIQAKTLPEDWMPQPESSKEFMALYLRSEKPDLAPPSVRAMHSAADALEMGRDAEKAKFLPKLGLFGTGDLYGGARGAATSYTAGAYFQWDIFSASNFGVAREAEQLAKATEARANGMSERTQITRAGAEQSVKSLEESLALMEESAKFLEEQTKTARELFQSGSINALQLVEVLARRADLLVNRTESELGLAQARATLFLSSGAEGVTCEY